MHVCVVALDDPWRQRDGGTVRTRLLVRAMANLGHQTSVAYLAPADAPRPSLPGVRLRSVAAMPLGERRWTAPMRTYKQRLLPLPTMRGGMIPALGDQIAELDPDVIVVSQLRAAPYLCYAPRAALWLDQADVWSLFLRRERATRRGLPRATATMQLRQLARAERSWAHRAAVITTAGYTDRSYLALAVERPVIWLPTAVAQQNALRVPDGCQTAGLLGNFDFWPNRDAFTVLCEHWAPALRRLGWKTVVAGVGSETLDGRGMVEILGQVDDLDDYYAQIDLALAPLRLGGGVKVKVIEALMYGRPVVASAHALEGFPPDLATTIPVVDDLNPHFNDILSADLNAETAFSLAHKYFSIGSWEQTVSEVLELTTRSSR